MSDPPTLKQIMQKLDELSKEQRDLPLEMHVYARLKDRNLTLAVVRGAKLDEFGGVVFELEKF